MTSPISKYISKYGLNRPYEIEPHPAKFQYAVVVPAIAESENIKCFLDSFLKTDPHYFKDTFLLFVINNHENSDPEVKQNNQRALKYLRDFIKHNTSDLRIGILDAASPGKEFPEKDAGVGLARKAGMDAVLPYFSGKGKNIIICTDADCTFDKNYLTEIVNSFRNNDADAAVINFSHRFDIPETAEAVICYEIFLRYYVLGLKYAASPFAFHTIGSAMSCTPGAYINIEGMNKRKAAEDFYFLEKLAKKFRVHKITGTTVYPSSRKSWRVPFGTGQRMNRHLSNDRDEYVLVHPRSFKILSDWNHLFINNDIFDGSFYLGMAKKISPALDIFLEGQNFARDWENILRNSKNKSGIMKKKIQWFDGFRTLKLIHYLRDNETGTAPMFNVLDEFFVMAGIKNTIIRGEDVPAVETQMQYLELLRKIDN